MVEANQVLQNRYLIQKKIGAGGMGTVYLATDERLNSPVAIKETLFTDDDLKRAFEREAQLLNSLRHPALPRVIDYFTEGDAQFLVMEYIAGEDLSALLKTNGAFPVRDVLRWADELLSALDYLHSQKAPVIHRDIKPQNLKLTDKGEVILLDFGLAKGKPGDTSKLTKTNSVFGYSRSYAPLEQIQGTGTDPRSDLYSLTATLYNLLTGKPPTDALSRATEYVNGNPDPLIAPENLNPQIPAPVSQFLLQGLELNAGLRPQSAEAMREELQKALENLNAAEVSEMEAEKTAAPPRPLTVAVPIAETDNELNNRKSFEVAIPPVENSASPPVYETIDYDESPARRNAWTKYVGIAAAVLLLGGGSAAWYATSQQTASTSNQNQTPAANVTANKKVDTATNPNVNTKAAVSASSTSNNQNAEVKTVQTVNANRSAESKTAASDVALSSGQPSAESAEKPEEKAPPAPIIVKSAPPTAELIPEVDSDEKEKKKAEDDEGEEEAEDNRREQRRRARERDNESSRIRERRVRDNRNNSQKLPTILGAPPK